jgi:hypothetical protein
MRRHAKGKYPKPKRPKTKLGLPDLDHSKSAVLDSLRSPESKRGYRHAIDEFIQWYCSEPRLSFNKVVVTRYRIFLENRQLAGERSTDDSPLYAGSPMKPRTLVCSVRSSRLASDG